MNKIELQKLIEETINVKLSDYSDEPAKVVKQLSNEAIGDFKSTYSKKPDFYERHQFKYNGVTLIINIAEDKCKIEHMDCCEDYISNWFDMSDFKEKLVKYHNGEYDHDFD